MEFFELIEARQSIRRFSEKPVYAETVEQILKAANRAPSAGNLQAFEIYLVTSFEKRLELAKAAFGQEFICQAPLSFVFCTNSARNEWKYSQRGMGLYAVQDATIACTFAMLAAADLGLGSVWVGAFDDQKVYQVIGEPSGLHPVAILPVGYPAVQPQMRPRRPLEELVHHVD